MSSQAINTNAVTTANPNCIPTSGVPALSVLSKRIKVKNQIMSLPIDSRTKELCVKDTRKPPGGPSYDEKITLSCSLYFSCAETAYIISCKQETTVLKSIFLSTQIFSEGLHYFRRYLNHDLIQIRKKKPTKYYSQQQNM